MNYELIDKEYTYKEQDPKYQGERIDTQLAEGPTDQRTCRDCLCFILYIALWVAMLVVACYAWKNGNPQLLAAPFDSTGHFDVTQASNADMGLQKITLSLTTILKT